MSVIPIYIDTNYCWGVELQYSLRSYNCALSVYVSRLCSKEVRAMFSFDAVWISFGLITYLALYWTFFTYVIRRRKARREESNTRLFKALQEGLKSGSITTIDDVVNVYKGVSGLSSEDLSYRYGLSSRLREFLVGVISKEKNIMDGTLDDETVRDWKQRITEFISQNEALSPYADLPPAERNLLNDITTFIERNDIESVKRKFSELAGMIQARNSDLERMGSINRWTVPLSIVGLTLTVVFGILALIG